MLVTLAAILIASVLTATSPTPQPPDDGLVPDSARTQFDAAANGQQLDMQGVIDRLTEPGYDSSDGQEDPNYTPIGCDALQPDPKACGSSTRDPGEPDVTLTDLATVRPSTPALTGDPVGYGLMNAPANIVATAADQTITTELFNRPVQVYFTPVSYTFAYGDGATRTSETGGATWEALGVPQFTPTATTHAYHERGTYTVTVTVAYAPYVNFGSGWRPVAGTVSATSGGYGIQIVEARTALVEHDCNEDPTGVGCPAG